MRRRQRNPIDEIVRHSADTKWEQKIPGGTTRAPATFEARSLIRGAVHELEHTTDPLVAMEIAMDHLAANPSFYDAPAVTNPSLTKKQSLVLERELQALLDQIPPEMTRTGPNFRRRVSEEVNGARWRLSRGQPELAFGHIAAAEASAGLLGDLDTLTYDDVNRREAELRRTLLPPPRSRMHNPSRAGSLSSRLGKL